MKISVLVILCFLYSLGFANKEVKLEGLIGEAFIENDISPNEARKKALNNAKKEALRKAGVEESVKAQNLLFKSEVNGDFSDFFSSNSQIEINGAIKDYSLTSERMYCKDSLSVVYEVVIKATVIKYNKVSDPSFTCNINGVKQVYQSNSNLNFSVKSTKACYLTIFNITDTEAYVLYPSSFESSIKLEGLKEYKFPLGKLDYTLTNDSDKTETNRLIFVITKKPNAFIKMDDNQVTKIDDIFSWIYSISPDERVIEYKSYFISN